MRLCNQLQVKVPFGRANAMQVHLALSFLVTILFCHPIVISGSAVVASQWVIFDAENTTALFGNPAYTGRFGVPYFAGKEIDTISFGENHAIALTSDGQLRAWGSSPLAYGGNFSSPIPRNTWNNPFPIVSIAATDGGSVIVLDDGRVFFVGSIVPSGAITSSGWSLLPSSPIKNVRCGAYHCVLQGADSKLYGFGSNDMGQLSDSTTNEFNNIFEMPNLPQTTILPSTKINFCTGAHHSAIRIDQSLYLLGDCRAQGSICIIPSRTPVIVPLPNEPIQQLECGFRHTVIKTPSGVYAIGDNEVGQVDPLSPGPPIPSLTRVDIPFGSTSRILVVGNSTLGRSSDLQQGLIQAFGINGTGTEALDLVDSLIGHSEFPRPPWLRLENNDQGVGSPNRYTLGIRFVEDDTCEDPRPLARAVCLGNGAGKGRWALQRSFQMAKNRAHSEMTLDRPLTIFGDFILESDASMNFQWPSDPDSPTLEVDGCAQINGALSLSVSSENVDSIKNDHKGKREVKLVQSKCPFFANSKRDVNVVLHSQTSFGSPDSTLDDAPEPDVSVEPTDDAKSGESQTKSVSYQPFASLSSSSSSCSKTTVTTEERTEGGFTTLIAIVTVSSSSCNTWWIITVSVVGGVILLLVVAAVIVLSNPKLRASLLPYSGTNSR